MIWREIIYLLYITSIFISAVTALWYWRSLKKTGLVILSVYLPLVFIQEVVVYFENAASNAIVYNLYRVVTVLVFAYLYYNIPFLKQFRKSIAWVIAVYLLTVVINYLFIESLLDTSSYMLLLRGFVMTVIPIFFLYSFFNLDRRDHEKYWLPVIWVTIGLVAFYPVVSISLAFQKYLAAVDATIHGAKLYQLIPRVMSIFMYGCFSYAFYICRKTNSNS